MSVKFSSIDGYPTETSTEQRRTEEILAHHRPDPNLPKPALQKAAHLQWLVRNFSQGFPERFVSQDASQPWLFFWTIQGFYFLGADLDPQNKQRCIDTIMACQHPDGGFGGGPGQFPHLLPTYAAVSALASVGRPGPRGGWDQINREKLYAFFMSLKQPDGSFLVSRDSEVDVRGIYCLLCVATLLNMLTPELVEGTASFIASLQTYEGGFSNASHPYFFAEPASLETLLDYPRPPLGEAHGGYTFCALASWVLLRPLMNKDVERKRAINLRKLTRWLSLMQGTEVELGGFKGRTNKLVDACYSWWVGGCFALLRSLGVGVHPPIPQQQHQGDEEDGDDEQWADVEGSQAAVNLSFLCNRLYPSDDIFNRPGLQEYILYAAQHPIGGLRDKPPKPADAYHTLYSLAGLSTAQHYVSPSNDIREKFRKEWKRKDDDPLDDWRKSAYVEARTWKEEEGGSIYVNGPGDRLNATHPIFTLTMTHVGQVMEHFYGQS
ncbi:terpenoid cyclases/Protein prenyltransferase [Fomitiporia mediterranea MF3/22]|uniref:terpenoid cyclases/Protein prenyltransferase n=1 Tax=Fomitiporia mediterranea (strain MF3/22) TaxID=694068 RepID=UPI0004408B9A|nr:terpenoid cyclases/Protein prenyltransferase [Fomitiporia mediterranea MF3/22]EJC99512.1 terpenoid cyclases/Protein prenyltransferase [Fomitiporia mediterranea MF3/22]